MRWRGRFAAGSPCRKSGRDGAQANPALQADRLRRPLSALLVSWRSNMNETTDRIVILPAPCDGGRVDRPRLVAVSTPQTPARGNIRGNRLSESVLEQFTPKQLAILKFLIGARWRELGDPSIARVCRFMRVFLVVYVLLIVSWITGTFAMALVSAVTDRPANPRLQRRESPSATCWYGGR
jgi:hypothetical protein